MDDRNVAVIGLGYVGLTLAVTLADLGFRVTGCERDPGSLECLQEGRSPFFEPGVDEVLAKCVRRNLFLYESLPQGFDGAIVICVSTPVASNGHSPDLRNLRQAMESVAIAMTDGSLVILRSTVPVGITRNLALPVLQRHHRDFHLAFCPERTIQGKALRELRELPQVVGGLDAASAERASALWKQVTQKVTTVSSLETAEMVKLINNCHTDLIYGYGNEVALMAHSLGLDPLELIHAANDGYPRPPLARPGFVGGPCLTKDPYLLIHSFSGTGYRPHLVPRARDLNEQLPTWVAQHFVRRLAEVLGGDIKGAKVLLCGFAYKGWPVTDDMRGAPVLPILDVLRQYGLELWGHDHMIFPDVIASYGVTPSSVEKGFADARAALIINEHPGYRDLPSVDLVSTMQRPALIYDCWRLFDGAKIRALRGVSYAGIGYG